MLGTGLHLQLFSLPAPEIVISASVLIFGAILAMGQRLNLRAVVVLGALAATFHGYAYDEAIFGAEASGASQLISALCTKGRHYLCYAERLLFACASSGNLTTRFPMLLDYIKQ